MTAFARLIAFTLCAVVTSAQTRVPVYRYRIVRTFHHDPDAFTQGLEYHNGYLYEGTGLPGHSTIRKVKLETGAVVQKVEIPEPYFGEGITLINSRLFEITWQHQTGFVYDPATFKVVRQFSYPGEGWGLTNDGNKIYMSDGSAQIRVWNPATLAEERRITVKDGADPVKELNELEWMRGEILANVWQTDRIARISPFTGQVTGWIDCSGLLSFTDRAIGHTDVLNGIAYDAAGDRLFVTGKLWPKLFEIKIVPKR